MDNSIDNPNIERMLAFLWAFIAVVACVLYLKNRRQQKPSEQEKAFLKLQKRYSSGVEGDYSALQSDWKNVYGDMRSSFDKLKEKHGLPAA